MIQALGLNPFSSTVQFGLTNPPGPQTKPDDLLKNLGRVPASTRMIVIGVMVGLTKAGSWEEIESHLGGNVEALDGVGKAVGYTSWQAVKEDAKQFDEKLRKEEERKAGIKNPG